MWWLNMNESVFSKLASSPSPSFSLFHSFIIITTTIITIIIIIFIILIIISLVPRWLPSPWRWMDGTSHTNQAGHVSTCSTHCISFMHPSIYSYPSIHSFIYSSIHPSIYSSIHLSIHPSIYSLIHVIISLGWWGQLDWQWWIIESTMSGTTLYCMYCGDQ